MRYGGIRLNALGYGELVGILLSSEESDDETDITGSLFAICLN
jgi:hypothetical protein